MKTRILAGIIISGVWAISAAQAAPSTEEIYSGLGTAAIQRVHQAAEQQAAERKSTCEWHETRNEVDQLYAAYPGDEYVEKDYLAASNMNFVC